ncbi:MAG: hypothetical protein IPO76_01090 [Elusimicrobia bacterium]|nr:hypothetical protein [Elusimicrobiota bacterium]
MSAVAEGLSPRGAKGQIFVATHSSGYKVNIGQDANGRWDVIGLAQQTNSKVTFAGVNGIMNVDAKGVITLKNLTGGDLFVPGVQDGNFTLNLKALGAQWDATNKRVMVVTASTVDKAGHVVESVIKSAKTGAETGGATLAEATKNYQLIGTNKDSQGNLVGQFRSQSAGAVMTLTVPMNEEAKFDKQDMQWTAFTAGSKIDILAAAGVVPFGNHTFSNVTLEIGTGGDFRVTSLGGGASFDSKTMPQGVGVDVGVNGNVSAFTAANGDKAGLVQFVNNFLPGFEKAATDKRGWFSWFGAGQNAFEAASEKFNEVRSRVSGSGLVSNLGAADKVFVSLSNGHIGFLATDGTRVEFASRADNMTARITTKAGGDWRYESTEGILSKAGNLVGIGTAVARVFDLKTGMESEILNASGGTFAKSELTGKAARENTAKYLASGAQYYTNQLSLSEDGNMMLNTQIKSANGSTETLRAHISFQGGDLNVLSHQYNAQGTLVRLVDTAQKLESSFDGKTLSFRIEGRSAGTLTAEVYRSGLELAGDNGQTIKVDAISRVLRGGDERVLNTLKGIGYLQDQRSGKVATTYFLGDQGKITGHLDERTGMGAPNQIVIERSLGDGRREVRYYNSLAMLDVMGGQAAQVDTMKVAFKDGKPDWVLDKRVVTVFDASGEQVLGTRSFQRGVDFEVEGNKYRNSHFKIYDGEVTYINGTKFSAESGRVAAIFADGSTYRANEERTTAPGTWTERFSDWVYENPVKAGAAAAAVAVAAVTVVVALPLAIAAAGTLTLGGAVSISLLALGHAFGTYEVAVGLYEQDYTRATVGGLLGFMPAGVISGAFKGIGKAANWVTGGFIGNTFKALGSSPAALRMAGMADEAVMGQKLLTEGIEHGATNMTQLAKYGIHSVDDLAVFFGKAVADVQPWAAKYGLEAGTLWTAGRTGWQTAGVTTARLAEWMINPASQGMKLVADDVLVQVFRSTDNMIYKAGATVFGSVPVMALSVVKNLVMWGNPGAVPFMDSWSGPLSRALGVEGNNPYVALLIWSPLLRSGMQAQPGQPKAFFSRETLSDMAGLGRGLMTAPKQTLMDMAFTTQARSFGAGIKALVAGEMKWGVVFTGLKGAMGTVAVEMVQIIPRTVTILGDVAKFNLMMGVAGGAINTALGGERQEWFGGLIVIPRFYGSNMSDLMMDAGSQLSKGAVHSLTDPQMLWFSVGVGVAGPLLGPILRNSPVVGPMMQYLSKFDAFVGTFGKRYQGFIWEEGVQEKLPEIAFGAMGLSQEYSEVGQELFDKRGGMSRRQTSPMDSFRWNSIGFQTGSESALNAASTAGVSATNDRTVPMSTLVTLSEADLVNVVVQDRDLNTQAPAVLLALINDRNISDDYETTRARVDYMDSAARVMGFMPAASLGGIGDGADFLNAVAQSAVAIADGAGLDVLATYTHHALQAVGYGDGTVAGFEKFSTLWRLCRAPDKTRPILEFVAWRSWARIF